MYPNRPSATRIRGRIKYALRCIAGDLQGKEFPLPEDTEIYIGRNPELDIVLYDDLVSREHAKVVCRNGVVEVEDLGSTNGTYVEAQRINKTVLPEGKRIVIGSTILMLVKIGTSTGFHAIQDSLLPDGQKPIMKGHLEELPLIDLLQMLHINKKSGIVALSNGRSTGYVFFNQGTIVYAKIEGSKISPLKAVYRLLAWKSGTFELGTASNLTFDRPIAIPTQTLLMESIKHNQALDELRRRYNLDNLAVIMPRPLLPSLADLDKERLRFLQIAHNSYAVSTYLDNAPASDFDAYRVLIELISQGYLEAVKFREE